MLPIEKIVAIESVTTTSETRPYTAPNECVPKAAATRVVRMGLVPPTAIHAMQKTESSTQ